MTVPPDLVYGVMLAALIVLCLPTLLRLATTLGPHCRCGHHKSVHRGPGSLYLILGTRGGPTRCSGTWDIERNPLRPQRWEFCTCRAYRPTAVPWWRRIWIGAEEQPQHTL